MGGFAQGESPLGDGPSLTLERFDTGREGDRETGRQETERHSPTFECDGNSDAPELCLQNQCIRRRSGGCSANRSRGDCSYPEARGSCLTHHGRQQRPIGGMRTLNREVPLHVPPASLSGRIVQERGSMAVQPGGQGCPQRHPAERSRLRSDGAEALDQGFSGTLDVSRETIGRGA